METLPTEILLLIFNQLEINDLINSVSHVCERWHEIIAEDIVRQHKVQAVIRTLDRSCEHTLEHNQFLVNNVQDKEDLELLRHCHNLDIHLTASAHTPCIFHYSPTLFYSCRFLQTKTLKVTITTEEVSCSNDLTLCTDFDMGSIVDIINQYTDLEFLALNILFISKTDAVRLTDVLQRKERLKLVEITMAIPLTSRARYRNDYIEPLQLNKLFYFANISAKINACYMLQVMLDDNNDAADYDCGLPNLGFV